MDIREFKERLIGIHNEIKKEERENKEKKDGVGYLIDHYWCKGFEDALEFFFDEVVISDDGDIKEIKGMED